MRGRYICSSDTAPDWPARVQVDILYNLYDLVSVGGYIVIDDYGWASGEENSNRESHAIFGAKDAVLDFRLVHGIDSPMHPIDGNGAWFRKEHEVALRRDRYLRTLTNQSSMREALLPTPPRTRKLVRNLQAQWLNNSKDSAAQKEWRNGLAAYTAHKGRFTKGEAGNWREVAKQVRDGAHSTRGWWV